ncbi:MAG: hypothetical protein GX491_20710 [Chloroflexi bacterium]|nr:hypothetical protein [Chloroflexota bacterium]
MIVLKIDDEATASYYEIIGIMPESLAGKSDKEAARAISDAAKAASRPYKKTANSGKKEAAEEAARILSRINEAATYLKDPVKRKSYNEELAAGKSAALDILRPQPIAVPFFRSRSARFRAVERLMRAARLYS